MLLGLMVYGYATKVFSSRAIERATYDSVAVETTHWCQRIRFPHKYLSLKTKWVTSILSLLTRFRSENPISDLPAGRVTTIGIPSLPRMLLDSESPLSLPFAVLPSMLPWFLHFMRACATTAAYASAASLAPLLAQAGAAWQRRWASALRGPGAP